jgi:hypothetical protein
VLPEKQKARFRDRLWVKAEGVIYDQFDETMIVNAADIPAEFDCYAGGRILGSTLRLSKGPSLCFPLVPCFREAFFRIFVIRLKFDSLIIIRDGKLVVAFLEICFAAIVVIGCAIRVKFDGLCKVHDGELVVAFLEI